jgi:ring-1,2-phenylacetyl-CoA epoxidase subunit PaaC
MACKVYTKHLESVMNDRRQELFDFVVAQADDAMVLGQRLSEWCSNAPYLEEDLAVTNVALDYVGRAKMFYEYAARLDGEKQSADDIAFMRDGREYCNLLIMELPIGDFAFSMVRQFLVDVFNVEYMTRLQNSNDSEIAAIAGKAVKESRYHLRRSHEWVVRLGDGTQESHERTQNAIDKLWGYVDELFATTDFEAALLKEGVAVDRALLRDAWNQQINAVFKEATLRMPVVNWSAKGGRLGIHTEHFGHMLAEMQFLQRAYPGLEW